MRAFRHGALCYRHIYYDDGGDGGVVFLEVEVVGVPCRPLISFIYVLHHFSLSSLAPLRQRNRTKHAVAAAAAAV